MRTQKRLIIVLAVLAVLVAALVLAWQLKSHRQTGRANTHTQKALTAGGMAVPQKWQARAERLGYYCPSWSASAGQASPGICLPLDK